MLASLSLSTSGRRGAHRAVRRQSYSWDVYENNGVVYVGVDTQDTEPAALAFLTNFGVTYPTGIDAENTISRSYQSFDLPTTVFIDRQGTIVKRWIGAIPEQQLVGWIDEIIARGTKQR
jgi:cytochrome c biogenesis protein CcmG/thiol:disulfide interchange protein DsbE